MVTPTQYKWAIKTIERYEDDLTSNRYISNQQRKSYEKARAIEDEMIKAEAQASGKEHIK